MKNIINILCLSFIVFISNVSVSFALSTCRGLDTSKWTDCFGSSTLMEGTTPVNDNDYYEGEWLNGRPHGHGILIVTNAGKNNILDEIYIFQKGNYHYYLGEFRYGGSHGQGVFHSSDGTYYQGEWIKDQRHGQGTYTFANGNKYIGEFKDDRFHGQGTYTWASGDKYVGEWKDDRFHGQGTYTHASGDKYVGEFNSGDKHGQGTSTYADGATYIGKWKDDLFHGQGTYTYASGDKYVGEYFRGKLEGKGTYTSVDGSYVGEFVNGDFHGQGVRIKKNVHKYEGDWQSGEQNGHGTITYSNGNQYIGQFLNNKLNGEGVLTYADGSEALKGQWLDGEYVTQRSISIKYDRKIALIIGNSKYEHTSPLLNPEADAIAIASKLTEMGFEVQLALDFTNREMQEALADFGDKALTADVALFYYAGHGFQMDGLSYLMPIDAELKTKNRAKIENVNLEMVIDYLSEAKIFGVILIDACRSNPLLSKIPSTTRSANRGLSIVETSGKNLIISYAAAAGMEAMDGESDDKNSPYASALINLLDREQDVALTFREVKDQVRKVTNGFQIPMVESHLSGGQYFLTR